MGCQIFHSGLTNNQSRDIENVQKKALKIILGKVYSNYEEACTLLSCEPLSDRRDSFCWTFIKRAVKSGQHKNIFIPAQSHNITRSKKNQLKEYTCNTQRYFNSPLVYLSRLYNSSLMKWYSTQFFHSDMHSIQCYWWIMKTGPSHLYCAH